MTASYSRWQHIHVSTTPFQHAHVCNNFHLWYLRISSVCVSRELWELPQYAVLVKIRQMLPWLSRKIRKCWNTSLKMVVIGQADVQRNKNEPWWGQQSATICPPINTHPQTHRLLCAYELPEICLQRSSRTTCSCNTKQKRWCSRALLSAMTRHCVKGAAVFCETD